MFLHLWLSSSTSPVSLTRQNIRKIVCDVQSGYSLRNIHATLIRWCYVNETFKVYSNQYCTITSKLYSADFESRGSEYAS